MDNEYKIVVGGDFNVAIDPDLDCSGGNQTKKDSVKNVQDLCIDFDLLDIWRIRNPETMRFTWRQKKSFYSKWINTFYKNISSCIMNNGFSTAFLEVQRGVRQGDPLSAYLFIIVLEILSVSIRSDQDIEGILVRKRRDKSRIVRR